MPIIHPPKNNVVSWPDNEGTIGVVGVAPWATIDFLKSLYAEINATKDWHYPRVICDINTKIPSRGRYLELNERDPSPFIRETIFELYEQGASVVVVPCNTAHILYDDWANSLPIPVPNIIDTAIEAIYKKGVKKAISLNSKSLYKYNLYKKKIQEYGIKYLDLTENQISLISTAIEEIKIHSKPLTYTKKRIENLLNDLEGNTGIILGCTELSFLMPMLKNNTNYVIDSNIELAKKSIAICYDKLKTLNQN